MVAYGSECLIDGSHWSADDFAIAVIRYAIRFGFEIDEEQFETDLWLLAEDTTAEDELLDIYEALTETLDLALDHLNDVAEDGTYFSVEDNSLFMEVGV